MRACVLEQGSLSVSAWRNEMAQLVYLRPAGGGDLGQRK